MVYRFIVISLLLLSSCVVYGNEYKPPLPLLDFAKIFEEFNCELEKQGYLPLTSMNNIEEQLRSQGLDEAAWMIYCINNLPSIRIANYKGEVRVRDSIPSASEAANDGITTYVNGSMNVTLQPGSTLEIGSFYKTSMVPENDDRGYIFSDQIHDVLSEPIIIQADESEKKIVSDKINCGEKKDDEILDINLLENLSKIFLCILILAFVFYLGRISHHIGEEKNV